MRQYFFIAALLVAVSAQTPLFAQLVIDQTPAYEATSVYKLPGVEPAAPTAPEEEVEPQRVYTGDPIVIDAACEADTLLAAGLSCTPASPCKLELELILAERVGERLLAAGSVRSAAGSLESVLLSSADGGESWTEVADRVPAGSLETAQFADKLVGWIGGQRTLDGAVSQPFLLYTNDGGASFDLRLVRAGGELREGFIEQIQFDSPTHGYLILEKPNAALDPFALYETYNGGRSWAIRQIVAERPAIPGARRRRLALVDSDLRLSAADGAIDFERQAGSAWERLASFSIGIGSCPAP